MADWSFFTNHGLVLATIAKQPKSTAREIGDTVGITERTAHKIINDLENEGYITKIKAGRKNRYRIHSNVPLVDEQSDVAVGELLAMLGWKRRRTRPSGTNTGQPA
ncbi:MAG: winged helix-turn-helix domain-containing protein [Dehalococcoidales bacterium]